MIFRNDDISPNSNFGLILEIYAEIRRRYPDAEIISAVNLLAKTSSDRSPYPALKPRDIDFPSVDRVVDLSQIDRLREISTIASHGLAHLDHGHISRDLQAFSIRASCEILRTKVFVPPFLRWNHDTEEICADHGIRIVGVPDIWPNLDNEPMDRSEKYCFHSWKFPTPEAFFERLR